MRLFRKTITFGYMLIVVLIGSIAFTSFYEWWKLESLEEENRQIDRFRLQLHDAYVRMMEFSLLGETILEWDADDLEHYHLRRLAMDSTLCRLKATYPSERIDSMRYLLEDKEVQMRNIVQTLDEQSALNKKIAGQVPVIVRQSRQEQPARPKRKGFLGLFGKKEKPKQTATTTMLNTFNSGVIAQQREQSRRLSEHADSLAARNGELNYQLQELITQMDAKVYDDLQKRESEITVMRENSYILVGGMTILAIILLLISYLTIHRNNLRINRYKKDTADLIGQLKQSVRENEALIASRKKAVHTITHDLRLPEGDSIELLRWMRKNDMQHPFIIMTNYGEVHSAVESMKLGSKDYIQKPLLEDRLIPLIRSIQEERKRRMQRQVLIFTRQGAAYQNIKKRVRLVAATRMSVLILGENGTGKEHIAQHIHAQSKQSDKPFVAVDCGALSPSLAQSAFFGHVKGAFTGADVHKAGYFQEAEGGTLFLDEVGNLTMEMQQMLLRTIQERRYRPIGAKEDKTANVRIVAATNEDLHKAVAEKRFRQDLLYRLQEYVITVPPLRDCREDIIPLAEFFREIANQELERNVKGFNASARNILLAYPWPGNVRELKQKILSAVLHTEGDMITEGELELGGEQTAVPVGFTLKNGEEEMVRILRALKQTDGNKKLAAKLLGIGRTTLYNKLEEYGIEDA